MRRKSFELKGKGYEPAQLGFITPKLPKIIGRPSWTFSPNLPIEIVDAKK